MKKNITSQTILTRQLYLIGLIFLFLLGLAPVPSQNSASAHFLQDTNRVFTYPKNQNEGDLASRGTNKLHVVKERFLEINLRPLESEDVSQIELELLDQKVYKVKKASVEKRSLTNYTWRGKIYNADGDGFDVILTIIDDLMTGLIYTPNKSVYQIIPIEKGVHKIVLIDQNKFPGCSGPIILPDSEKEPVTSIAKLDNTFPITINTPKNPSEVSQSDNWPEYPEADTTTQEDTNSKIDVLLLYTSEAIKEARGMTQAKVHAQGTIDATNTAYANSKISTRLNLVDAVAFNIAETTDYSSLVNSIRIDSEVSTRRNSTKADLVSLIVSSSSSSALCGIGFLTSTGSSAFSVVNFGCAIGNLSFAHELGHNMGCQHNPENGGAASSGAFPFSFGHYVPNKYRTIMSTASPENPCGNCTREPYFSNPNVTFQQAPTGTSTRNNAQTINERASVVANFQQGNSTRGVTLSVTPATRFILQGQTASYTLNINRTDFPNEILVSAFCVNSDDCPFTSNLVDVKTTANTINFTVSTSSTLPVGNYLFTVKATSNAGTIQDSNNFLLVVKGIPSISNATYSKSTLTLSGKNFERDDRIVLNNKEITTLRASQSSTSVALKGSKKKLGIVSGANTITVFTSNGVSSNRFTFNSLDN